MKHLKNIDLLSEFLSAVKTNKAFKGYVMTYKVLI